MRIPGHFAVVLLLLAGSIAARPSDAQTIVTLASGFNEPGGVAVDGNGNVFVADTANSAIKELVTAGGQVTVNTIGTGFGPLGAVAVDAAGNIFAIDSQASRVFELAAADGYATAKTLGSGFNFPTGIALDSNGNVFVADNENGAVKEILAAGGYVTVNTLGSGFFAPGSVAVDSSGNVFVADAASVKEILAAGGYTTVNTLGGNNDLGLPVGVALDSQGNVFVAGLFSTVVEEIPAAGGYSTVKSLAGGFTSPQGIAVDGSDNLYLFDDNAAWKLPVSGGYSTATKLGSGFPGANGIAADAAGDVFLVGFGTSGIQEALVVNNYANLTHIGTPGFSVPAGIAIDASGNVYVADTGNNAVKEMTAASGFATVKTIGNGFVNPSGVTVDTNGNVFVADTGNNAVTEVLADGSQKILGDKLAQPTAVAVDISGDVFFANQQGLLEITTAGAVNSVVNQPGFFSGVALDSNGNLFLSNNDPIVTTGSEVRERLAATGFKSVMAVGSGFDMPGGVAVDRAGNVFVADTRNNAVKEILPAPPVLVAAVLPGSRSIELGDTATIFATLINTGMQALDNCQIAPASTSFFTLPFVTMNYQTTDPATNTPTGQPNTPVSIPGNNGAQSFLVSFQSTADAATFSSTGVPLDFTCGTNDVVDTAAIVPGVDTVDLSASSMPVADVIALAATPTNNGVIDLPAGGVGAFAIASFNVGATQALTLSADTRNGALPVVATLCQTDPGSGQCLSPPTPTVSLNYAGGAAPTFSVFLQSTGPIAFAPATSRIYIQFDDSDGGFHGSTSVAIEAQ